MYYKSNLFTYVLQNYTNVRNGKEKWGKKKSSKTCFRVLFEEKKCKINFKSEREKAVVLT